MKREFWSKEGSVPPISEVIETVEIYCSTCGKPIQFVVPEHLKSSEELAEHYRKVANHYAEKCRQAESIIKIINEIPK